MTRLRRLAISLIKSKGARSIAQKMRQLTFNSRAVFDYFRMTQNVCAPAPSNWNKFTVVEWIVNLSFDQKSGYKSIGGQLLTQIA